MDPLERLNLMSPSELADFALAIDGIGSEAAFYLGMFQHCTDQVREWDNLTLVRAMDSKKVALLRAEFEAQSD